jgi:hypothetical protein
MRIPVWRSKEYIAGQIVAPDQFLLKELIVFGG